MVNWAVSESALTVTWSAHPFTSAPWPTWPPSAQGLAALSVSSWVKWNWKDSMPSSVPSIVTSVLSVRLIPVIEDPDGMGLLRCWNVPRTKSGDGDGGTVATIGWPAGDWNV